MTTIPPLNLSIIKNECLINAYTNLGPSCNCCKSIGGHHKTIKILFAIYGVYPFQRTTTTRQRPAGRRSC